MLRLGAPLPEQDCVCAKAPTVLPLHHQWNGLSRLQLVSEPGCDGCLPHFLLHVVKGRRDRSGFEYVDSGDDLLSLRDCQSVDIHCCLSNVQLFCHSQQNFKCAPTRKLQVKSYIGKLRARAKSDKPGTANY